MEFLQLPHESWHGFFTDMTQAVRGRQIDVEIVGMDVGDEQEAEGVPLSGITYEPVEDALYVFVDGEVDHGISHPREIYVELGEAGVKQLVVFDAQDRREFVRIRAAMQLPYGDSG
jgi:hypothetical protein